MIPETKRIHPATVRILNYKVKRFKVILHVQEIHVVSCLHGKLASAEHVEEGSANEIIQETAVFIDQFNFEVTGDHHHSKKTELLEFD